MNAAESIYSNPPEIEVSTNASAFAIFASVRNAIFEKHLRAANEVYRTSNCTSPSPLDLSDTIDTDSDEEDRNSVAQTLPKVLIILLLTFEFEWFLILNYMFDSRLLELDCEASSL